jgi:hypothetical protein
MRIGKRLYQIHFKTYTKPFVQTSVWKPIKVIRIINFYIIVFELI